MVLIGNRLSLQLPQNLAAGHRALDYNEKTPVVGLALPLCHVLTGLL